MIGNGFGKSYGRFTLPNCRAYCYGYGIKANTDWKKTLGSEWRQYEEIFPKTKKSNLTLTLFH
jgi:hypothetical protein